jgi:hypothetical protein
MRGTLLILLVLTFVSVAFAQKASTVLGEQTVKGVVVTANEATREITLAYPDKDKTQTFVAVLESGYKQKLRDGTFRELAISELKSGLRLRVFYKQKTELVNGRKVKVAIISRIDFLGRDEYTKLREILDLPPSFPVTRVESEKLPAADPLKIYLSSSEPFTVFSYSLGESGDSSSRRCRRALHFGRERGVHVTPGSFNIGCEGLAQAFAQRPEKRLSNCVVIFVSNPVHDVSHAQRSYCWQNLLHTVKTIDRQSEHLH